VGGLLAFHQQVMEEAKEHGRILAAHSTVDDPNNPPRVEIEEWWGQHGKHTIFRNAGGTMTFHPPPGFDWKKTQDEISARFAWIGWVGGVLISLGGVFLLTVALRILLSLIWGLSSLMKSRRG